MLPKENRLVKKENFERAKRKGVLFQSKSFGFLVFNRKDNLPSRFGTIVSTKVDKRAVKRNWARRIVKEGIRDKLKTARNGLDVAILIKPSIKLAETKEISDELTKIFGIAEISTEKPK